jgi:hypothetical protein
VAETCTCGALLPADARFCHKCGKPQREEDIPAAEPAPIAAVVADPAVPTATAPAKRGINFHNSIAVRVAFLAAGLVTLLGAVPLPMVIAALWHIVMLVAGGFYAVYLYGRRTGESLSVRSGARMGWITGVFAFVIMTVLFTVSLVTIYASEGVRDLFRKMAENSPGADMIDKMLQTDTGLAMFIMLSLFVSFLTSTILPVLGGALGAKVLEKE